MPDIRWLGVRAKGGGPRFAPFLLPRSGTGLAGSLK